MIKLITIEEELEQTYGRAYELNRQQITLADRLFTSQDKLEMAKSDLENARAKAIKEKKIQQKEHGVNAALRDAHEYDYLHLYHKAVRVHEASVSSDRHELEQNQRDLSNVRLGIQVLQSRAKILMAILVAEQDNGE